MVSEVQVVVDVVVVVVEPDAVVETAVGILVVVDPPSNVVVVVRVVVVTGCTTHIPSSARMYPDSQETTIDALPGEQDRQEGRELEQHVVWSAAG